MRVRTWSKLLSAPAILLVGGLVLQACAKQGEAERCEVDSDCESGLTCRDQRYCCPPQGQETTAECKPGGGTVPTPDTGTADTATTDTATADTSGDTEVDSATTDSASADTSDAAEADAADAADAD